MPYDFKLTIDVSDKTEHNLSAGKLVPGDLVFMEGWQGRIIIDSFTLMMVWRVEGEKIWFVRPYCFLEKYDNLRASHEIFQGYLGGGHRYTRIGNARIYGNPKDHKEHL